jgi:TetR/AcrR family transcriptional regulator, transcriptional repressor of aconitase
MPKVNKAHLDARRAQIIDAASICFSRRGLHGTTMQDIIRESGLSAGAIYSYFESKNAIVVAIADERHAVEQSAIRNAGREADFGEMLGQLSQYFVGSLRQAGEQERRRVGIQLWAEALHDDELLAVVRRGVDEPRKMLAAMAKAAQQQGRLRPEFQPDATARIFIALFHGLILQQAWDKRMEIKPYLAALDALRRLIVTEQRKPAANTPG